MSRTFILYEIYKEYISSKIFISVSFQIRWADPPGIPGPLDSAVFMNPEFLTSH